MGTGVEMSLDAARMGACATELTGFATHYTSRLYKQLRVHSPNHSRAPAALA